jgi:hypothetical protein
MIELKHKPKDSPPCVLDRPFRNPVPAVIKALVTRLLQQAKPKVTTK